MTAGYSAPDSAGYNLNIAIVKGIELQTLAKMSYSHVADCIAFTSPTVDVLKVFKDDCNGVWLNRFCPAPLVIF